MVEATETSDVLLLYCGGVVAENESICVGRVGDHHAFDIWMCKLKGFCLFNKDDFVELKQILSLHPRFTRLASDKNDNVCILEHLFCFVTV